MDLSCYDLFCSEQQKKQRWRSLRTVEPATPGRVVMDGQLLVNFSSNNYLGLANHPLLKKRARAWTETWGTGATASRLVCGNLALFQQVEEKLCCGKGCESALVFNAGFQANGTILPALLDQTVLGAEPLIFSDRLNHASIHHGCRAAGVRQIRYRHNDLNHLETLLKQYQHRPAPRFILSETVFSMDGDRADVAGLLDLKARFGAFLYLDEAHATGVLGPGGFGLAAAFPGRVDLVMGTFSKGLGGFGAYAACRKNLRDYLINRCGGFIYATALPPAVLGAMDAALELLRSLEPERTRLLVASNRVRQAFQNAGLDTGNSTTQIVPLLLGNDAATLALSHQLQQAGILAVAIRPPTVPQGQSRIRFSLTADHDDSDLDHLIETTRRLV